MENVPLEPTFPYWQVAQLIHPRIIINRDQTISRIPRFSRDPIYSGGSLVHKKPEHTFAFPIHKCCVLARIRSLLMAFHLKIKGSFPRAYAKDGFILDPFVLRCWSLQWAKLHDWSIPREVLCADTCFRSPMRTWFLHDVTAAPQTGRFDHRV